MQDDSGAAAPRERPRLDALRLALGYAAAAALWILGSDWLLARLIRDPDWLAQASAVKGWLFVALTALLLYALLRRGPGPTAATAPRTDPAAPSPRDVLRTPVLAWPAMGIVTLTLLVLLGSYQQRRTQQLQQLEALAEQQSGQVATWFSYHQAQVRFVRTSLLEGEAAARRRSGPAAGAARLLERLVVLREVFGNQAAYVFDPRGELLASEPGRDPDPAPPLREQVLRAAATGEVQHHVGTARGGGSAWIDLAVPVPGAPPAAPLVAVLRVDLDQRLLPLLRHGPGAPRSAQSLLVRREGDTLVDLFDSRAAPLERPGLLAGRAVLGQMPLGRAAEGVDFRGVPVAGVVQQVHGTEWLLVAKLDAAELHGESLKGALWIAATGALALLGLFIAALRAREREALAAAQAQRAAHEEQLRALALVQDIADSSSDAIFAKDRQGRYILCNREAARLMGAPAPSVLGRDDQAFFPAAQAELLRANDARVVAQARVFSYEEELHTSDGLRTFLSTKGPLHDADGHVIGMFGIARDFTERKRDEVALREANALVQAVTDSVLDHMAVLDREGTIVKVNAAWTCFAGENGARLGNAGLGMNYLQVCANAHGTDAEEAPQVAEGIAAVLAGTREFFSLEYPCHAPHRRRWFHMTVTPLRTEAGGAVVVHTDISERHEAQAQLRKLSLAVAQSPIGIAIRDTAGHFEYVNDAFTRMSGFAREELLGRHACVLQSALAPALLEEQLWQALQRGETWAGEFHNRRPDGEPYDVFVHAAPIRQDGGRITHHLWIGEDVTEKQRIAAELDRHRHRLQELVDARTQQLRQANDALVLARDRADAANQAKSAFLANMSHEIRTPLNAILGLTHLLRRDAHDAVALERLAKVGNAAAHLLQVVNDVLDLSKIEAGRLDLEEAPFSLRSLLEGSRALVAAQAQAKGLSLRVDAGTVPDALRGDATRLSQALLNLLSNAVKFTPHGRVEVLAQVLAHGERGLLLGLRVRDTGVGIAPDKLSQIFGAFVQEDASTTRRFGGTGLGLAITQHLASLMGGRVEVRSEPGVGSEFLFSAWVREHDPAAAASLPQPASSPAGRDAPLPTGDAGADAGLLCRRCGGARVLLAEDDPISQGVAQELLNWAGLQVQAVDDGAQAVAAASEGAYDLILLDVQMPRMDGLEAARRIRALPGHAATPMLALTTNAFASDRARCLDAGMDDHVPKPVDPAALFAALLRWLPERAQARPGALAVPGAEASGPSPAAGQAHEAGAAAHDAVPGPTVPGLDPALALRYLGGQAGLYRRVLGQFLRHYAGAPQRARAALAADDRAALKALVHGLGGTAEPVGAAGLAQRARALDQALAAGTDTAALRTPAQALLDELQALLDAIAQALGAAPAEDAAGAAAVDAARLRALAQLLRAGDYGAVAAWRSLAPALRRLDPAAAAEIEAQLTEFDFEGAVKVLEGVRLG